MFWSKIFSDHGKSVVCKSLGSKTVLRPLAERVISENLSHVLVAMDRDYEGLRGSLLHDSRVLYTYGYSWESDVFMDFSFDHALALFATVAQKRKFYEDYKAFLEKQSRVLKRLTALDLKYIGHNEALFDREKPLAIINASGSSEPFIKVDAILAKAKAIGKFQTCSIPEAIYRALVGLHCFYGKVVSRLIFHWFVFRTKKIPSCRKTSFDTFAAMAISSLDVTNAQADRNAYYSRLVASV
ncbi:hypothetical protein [Falsirhodobacter deserti]|uniref:hypothetical protein n=1 Tax=Falsirhodobacter deserti TaxID=1365611 RepID=UPI000FE33176